MLCARAVRSLRIAALLAAAAPAASGLEIPPSFEANRGQVDERVRFVARAASYEAFVTDDEIVLALRGRAQPAALRMRLAGGRHAAEVAGLEPLAARSHYLVGRDRAQWRTGVPHYGRVVQRAVRDGVDVAVHATAERVEYDVVLAAGVDPASIAIDFDGAGALAIDADGSLRLATAAGDVVQRAPIAWQDVAGARRRVDAAWRIAGARRAAFAIGPYDPHAPLVIDPVVEYATYLGTAAAEAVYGVAVDANGSAFLTGVTSSLQFPTVIPYQANSGGGDDAFVAKLSPDGGSLLYATYFGGASRDVSLGIAVDAGGHAYVTGSTGSPDLPIANAAQPLPAAFPEAWLAKFTPDGGDLVYSTFLGGSGSDSGWSVAADAAGNVALIGETGSTDFPVLNAAQPLLRGPFDAFVASYDAVGAKRWVTYLGGSNLEIGRAVAVEPDGTVHAGGQTQSCDFPVLAALQASCGGLADGFVAEYDAAGARVFSTYLGGTGDDYVFAIATDRNGSTYATGRTGSANFPVHNALQPVKAASADAFVTKLDRSGAPLYSTFLGGNAPENFTTVGELFRNGGIAADERGSVFVAGVTQSTDFPLANPFQPGLHGISDAFVARLTPDGQKLAYASYLGGSGREVARAIAIDAAGAAYVVGDTESADFPATALAYDTGANGLPDGFAAKIDGTPACANGIDDDGDAAIDYPDDAGCLDAASLIENPACDDGIDNDGDGHVDDPDDPECFHASDPSEGVDCSDGIDNDGDALLDAADPGCASPNNARESSRCQNGIDDDGDGAIDFDGGASWNKGVPLGPVDPHCSAAYRNKETPANSCGLGAELVAAIGVLRRARCRIAQRKRSRAS